MVECSIYKTTYTLKYLKPWIMTRMTNRLIQKLGERTKLAKAHSKTTSLRITVPESIVKQWNLREGDELDWSWQAKNDEMILEVRKVTTAAEEGRKAKK